MTAPHPRPIVRSVAISRTRVRGGFQNMPYEFLVAIRYLDLRRLAVTTGVVLVSLITLTMVTLHVLTLYSQDGRLSNWEYAWFLIPLAVIAVGWRILSRRGAKGYIAIITSISVCGVTIGVMALLVVISVMNGFGDDIRARILGTDGHLRFRLGERVGGEETWSTILDYLAGRPGVEAAAPRIDEFVLISPVWGENHKPVRLRGIHPEREADVTDIQRYLDPENGGTGNLYSLAPPRSPREATAPVRITDLLPRPKPIILGSELAIHLLGPRTDPEDFIGERVKVYPPHLTEGVMGPMHSAQTFEVVGIFKSGMYEYDLNMAYTSLDTMMSLLGRDWIQSVDLRLANSSARAAEATRQAIQNRLVEDFGYALSAFTWMELNEPFFRALQIEKVLIFIIQVLVVLVAAFNIASTLIMMVMSKTRDIGVLMSLGTEKAGVRRIFTLMGAGVGIVGTLVGCLLAFLLCLYLKTVEVGLPTNVYYVPTLPVRMHPLDFVIVAAASCLICFLAALFPARQASKLTPVEALRYE